MDGLEFNKDPILFARIITTLVEFIKNEHPEDSSRISEVDDIPNGKLTHVGLGHVYMLVARVVLCLLVASYSQEHLEGKKESKAKEKFMIGKKHAIMEANCNSVHGSGQAMQASLLLLVTALGTPWDFLDQIFAAIMGYRKKMWGMSGGDVERLGTELERLTCETQREPCKLLRREGGESLRYLDAKLTLEMGQNERKEVAGSIGLIRARIEFLGLHFVYSCDIMIGTSSRLRPYHFTYPKRELTMEEILHKFIDLALEKHNEAEDLATYHLSRFKNPHMEVLTKREIVDKFSDDHLMVLKSKFKDDEPWYANFINYIVGKVVPPNWTFEKRKRFFSQVKTYFWKEPYAFKLCADNIMRRCVARSETLEILAHCHLDPTGGHHSANVTAKKVYEAEFYWPSVFKDANETAYKTPTWCTPFRLVHEKACHLPVEIEHKAHWALKQCNMNLTLASESHLMQLNELAELRDGAYENTKIYKERTKKWHDSRLHGDKDFKVGDKVLLYNSCLRMYTGKLKSKWSGPNIVKTVYPHGAIKITNRDGFSFKVNGQRLKKYYRGDIDKEDDEVIELENDTTRSWREYNLKTLTKTKVLAGRQPGIVLYKVEDIATYLVEYVKFWDDWEVDRYGNANLGTIIRQKEKVIAHDSLQLTVHEKNYTTYDLEFGEIVLTLKIWEHYRYDVAFCLLEDLTAFCLKISLRFASRPHCVLLQDIHCVLLVDLTVFCLKNSLRFASSYHYVLLQYHCVLLKTSIAFCLKIILRFDRKTDYESWSQRIRLYYRGKENGLQILQSIDQGPFELGTTRDALGTTPEGGVLLGPERPRTYEDLSDTEKKRYDADVRATNIVLQGLPKDIYKLINHNIEAKAIWDNVKMLLAGSELTKEDRESQLYDEFERFKMLPGENINEYYVRFHKLVNDMRNIRMTMPNIQLNSKFVNNMSPEWDRFVTAVKLNKGLKETNHEQLYAYLKQHEKHAAQDRLIIERITPATNDQLAFVSTVQPHAQSSHVQSHQYPSSSTNPQSLQYPQFPETSQIDSGYTQTDEILDNLTKQMALLAQSFRATLPQTNNQLRTSSNTRNQATIQDGRVVVQNVQGRQNQNQRYFARGNGTAGNGGAQNRAGNANAGQGKPVKCYNCNGVGHIARNCTQPKRLQNSDYFKDKMLLMQAQENGAVLDEEELLFLAGEQGNTFDADVDNQPVQDLALNIQMLMMNRLLSQYSWPIFPQSGQQIHKLDEPEVHNKVQPSDVIDTTSVHMGNSNVIPYEQYLSVNDISGVPSCASSTLNSVCVSPVNDAFVPHDPIATELKIYKEQVAIYEQRAKFELTEREQRMDDQMRMLIQNRNKTEEKLKKELHSFKLQLKSTMENNKIIEETAKRAQPVLYDGDELLKPHHVSVIISTSEEELELAWKLLGINLHVKMYDSACVEKEVLRNVLPDLNLKNLSRNKIQNDDHDSMIKHFSKLEVEHFNLQLKYQNLKERFGNKKPVTSSDAPSFDSLFVIGKLNEQIQSRGNTIRELKEKISRLTKKNSDTDPIFDLKALVSQNKDLTAKPCPSRSQ
ncbi:retrovirus-related pol polyprotein from transposon TNT 1-94 [Tanacetum coccineum]